VQSNYQCHNVLNHPLMGNINQDLIFLSGHYALAQLIPVIVNTSEIVISRFAPNERGCYTEEEINLKYLPLSMGYRYSPKNCLYAALVEKILINCSCIPDYFWLGPEFTHVLPCRYD